MRNMLSLTLIEISSYRNIVLRTSLELCSSVFITHVDAMTGEVTLEVRAAFAGVLDSTSAFGSLPTFDQLPCCLRVDVPTMFRMPCPCPCQPFERSLPSFSRVLSARTCKTVDDRATK